MQGAGVGDDDDGDGVAALVGAQWQVDDNDDNGVVDGLRGDVA